LDEYKLVANFYIEAGGLHPSREDTGAKRPVFFATIAYNDNNRQVFNQLGFSSVPNLFVSQPKIVVVPQEERSLYLRDYKWSITHTDGHVTAHKLLEYINKRTTRNVYTFIIARLSTSRRSPRCS
jgi:oligosaccharyltransferase complex subunit gamma